MRMAFGLVIVALSVAFIGAAVGQEDPIKARKQLMKENDASSRLVIKMILGRDPYDATSAAAAMNNIAANMEIFPTLFPEGSDGGDAGLLPIWENMDDFKALAAKEQADAKAAAEVAPDGLDAFKVAFQAVSGDCAACHLKYRH